VPTVLSASERTYSGANEDLNEDNSDESVVEDSILAENVVFSLPKKRLKNSMEKQLSWERS